MKVEIKVFKDGKFYLMYREVGKSADAGQRSNPYTLQFKGKYCDHLIILYTPIMKVGFYRALAALNTKTKQQFSL